MQDVTNPVSLSYLYCMCNIPVFLDSVQYFFFWHTIGLTAPPIFLEHHILKLSTYIRSTSRSVQVSAPFTATVAVIRPVCSDAIVKVPSSSVRAV